MLTDKTNAPQGPENGKRPVFVKCAECATVFQQTRQGQRFCPAPAGKRVSPCATAWGNRNTSRGGAVVPIMLAWAMTRHAKSGTREADINRYARRELTAMARDMIDEDKAEDRGSVLEYVGALMDSRAQYVDRKR